MTGPKLENALQGLQQAIHELDQTIMDTSEKFRMAETGQPTDIVQADNVQAGSLQTDSLQADNLRAELKALRQMIQQASALIDGTANADAPSAPDEVVH